MRPLPKVEDCLNYWTPEQLEADRIRSQDSRPIRYLARTYKLSLLETCWWWLLKRRWIRYANIFDPVYPDDPRYELAPFESSVIWHR